MQGSATTNAMESALRGWSRRNLAQSAAVGTFPARRQLPAGVHAPGADQRRPQPGPDVERGALTASARLESGQQPLQVGRVVLPERAQIRPRDLLRYARRRLQRPQFVRAQLGWVETDGAGGAARADAVQGGDADELQGRVRAAAQERDGAVLVGEVHRQIGVEGDAVEQPERPPDLVAEFLERAQAALELRVDEQRHLDLLLRGRFQLPDDRRRGLARPTAAQHPPGEPATLAAPAREGAKLERLDELAQVAFVAGERFGFDGFHAPPMLDEQPQGCRAAKT